MSFQNTLSFFFLLSFSFISLSSAIEINHDHNIKNTIFSSRFPTPKKIFSTNLSIPQKFNHSNNLVRKSGSFYSAIGEVIYIKGKVTDSFGIPIANAIIKIWQTNAAGKYHSLLEDSSDYIDKNFNMSGTAVTNNLGEYKFVTIMPGFYIGRSPHININIHHKRFGFLGTEFYFEKHPRNKIDYQYLKYTKKERDSLTAKVRLFDIFDPRSRKICIFDITMRGIHEYKGVI